MLKTILTVAGKPGLYKLISSGRNMLIVEAIDASKKRQPVHAADKKASNEELADFFAEVLPNYDRDRVYMSHVRKLIQWYNILVSAGITEFAPEEPEAAEEEA